ncbi:MAG: fimbria/pilus outer membrane usher protein, partial [Nitrospirota bacterium]
MIPRPALGDETVILNIVLNHVDQGEYFVVMIDRGDFLVRTEDLRAMGLRRLEGKAYEIGGETYLQLSSIPEVEVTFDEPTLSLRIVAVPSYFEKHVLDIRPPRRSDVREPSDTSAFLNYALTYTSLSSASSQVEISQELGVRYGEALFLSDSIYTGGDQADGFVRLMSRAIYDRRRRFQRLIVGDFLASSGNIGNSMNVGGLSVQKVYQMDPHLIPYPTPSVSGAVTFPSRMEVFLDGLRIRQETLAPGDFDLRNLSIGAGAGVAEIVLTDPFGNEQRIVRPFYLSNSLLNPGLHEYSYNIGVLRTNFGRESFSYDGLVLSGFHRYGVNESVTAAFQMETLKQQYNAGPSASIRVRPGGVVTVSLAQNRNADGKFGAAGRIGYLYQSRLFSANLSVGGFHRHYASVSADPADAAEQYEVTGGAGYNISRLGSVTVNFEVAGRYEGPDRQAVTLGYSRQLSKNLSLTARVQWANEAESAMEVMAGLVYIPGRQISVSTRYRRTDEAHAATIQVQKNPPLGEGFGGRVLVEQDDATDTTVDAFLQYNARYGAYRGSYRSFGGDRTLQAAAAG